MGAVEKWNTVKLQDIAEFKTGKLNSNAAVVNGKYPFFTCSRETFKTNTWSFDCECVLLAGNNANAEYPVKYFKGKFDAYQRTYVITTKDHKVLNIRYLYYGIELKLNLLKSLSTGAATRFITKGIIDNLEFNLPGISEQDRIVNTLAAYDNLIENNNRRIAILEEMAQSLYREWFVKFRFPGHENTKFIDSPLGKIPEGWEVKKLENLTTKIGSGATPRGGKKAYKSEGTSQIRSMNVYDGRFKSKDLAFIDDNQAEKLNNVIIEDGDVLLNITGASVARCCIVPHFVLPARVNQHVAIVRADKSKVSPFYIFNYLTSQQGKSRLLSLSQGGATREALTKSTIENYELILPQKHILDVYDELARNTNNLKENLMQKNANMKSQRDSLLPKLISGNVQL